MIRQKPPGKLKQMRPRNGRDAVPGDLFKIQVLRAVAINVDIIFGGKTLDAFGDASLGAVAFVKEWRNNCDAGFSHGPARAYWMVRVIFRPHSRTSSSGFNIAASPHELRSKPSLNPNRDARLL
jgi:hypothetical protein